MSHELLYTSAPQGLKPGSRGFCTVEMTEGIPPGLVDRLESLSGYRQAFPIHDPRAKDNPVNYSHLLVPAAGQRFHVLSRVADAGQDYTGRSNKLAHHVALEPQERPAGNPAWVLRAPGFCQTAWDGTPRVLTSGRRAPSGTRGPGPCPAWKQAAGDAGWAGVLVQAAVEPGAKPVSVIYPAGMDVLRLVEEALALVPGERQWEVTFSTYFTKLPAGIECQWRFVPDETPEAQALRRNVHADVIDLCRPFGQPPASDFVNLARQGRMAGASRAAAPPLPPIPSPERVGSRPLPEPAATPARGPAFLPVAPAAPPPIAAAPAVPVPPQRPRESATGAAQPDDTYDLSSAAPPPRWTTSTATVGDLRAARTLEQIERGEPESVSSGGRGVMVAAAAVLAVSIVAITAYLLGRGSTSADTSADISGQTDRIPPAASSASRPSNRQTARNLRTPDARPPNGERRGPVPGSGSPGIPLSSHQAAGPARHVAQGVTLGGTSRPEAAATPAATSDGPAARSETGRAAKGIADEKVPNAAPIPEASGSAADSETSAATSESPSVSLRESRRGFPDLAIVIGQAELDLNESPPADGENRSNDAVWYLVLPGTEAQIEVQTAASTIHVSVIGDLEGGLLSIAPALESFDALRLTICHGKLIVATQQDSAPQLSIRHVRHPGDGRSGSSWSKLVLPGSNHVAIEAPLLRDINSDLIDVFSPRQTVRWRERFIQKVSWPAWYDPTTEERRNRLGHLESVERQLGPGIHPLRDVHQELQDQLTQIQKTTANGKTGALAASGLKLLARLVDAPND